MLARITATCLLIGRQLRPQAAMLARSRRSGAGSTSKTTTRMMGYGSQRSDNDPDLLEREKIKNLKGETGEYIPGMEGWNERLASDSEANVKADRHAPESIEEMQEHTIQFVLKKDRDAVSPGEGPTATPRPPKPDHPVEPAAPR